MALGTHIFKKWIESMEIKKYNNIYINVNNYGFNVNTIYIFIKGKKYKICQLFINKYDGNILYVSFNTTDLYSYVDLINSYNNESYNSLEKYIMSLREKQVIVIDNLLDIKMLIYYIYICNNTNIDSSKHCDVVKFFNDVTTVNDVAIDKLSYTLINRYNSDIKYYYGNESWRNLFVINETNNLTRSNITPNFLVLYDWSYCSKGDNEYIICILENYDQRRPSIIEPTHIFELYYSLFVIHYKLNISNLKFTIVTKKNITYEKDKVNVYVTTARGEYDTYVFPSVEKTMCLYITSYSDGNEYIANDYKNLSTMLNTQIDNFFEYFSDHKFNKNHTEKSIANIYNYNNYLLKYFKKIHQCLN